MISVYIWMTLCLKGNTQPREFFVFTFDVVHTYIKNQANELTVDDGHSLRN